MVGRMSTDTALAAVSEELDGRRRRSLDSRGRVVAALLDLVREGDVAPSAERVAARATVGPRTVFRHFNDKEGLYREMACAIESELAASLAVRVAGAGWRERLIGAIGKRAALYEAVAPFKRAADAHRHRSAFLAAAHARIVAMARRGLEDVAPLLVREDAALFEILDLLMSFETWSRLRQEQGLSVAAARESLERAVRAMIAAVGEPAVSPSPLAREGGRRPDEAALSD
jgi:AcrR family transcriptional regulator